MRKRTTFFHNLNWIVPKVFSSPLMRRRERSLGSTSSSLGSTRSPGSTNGSSLGSTDHGCALLLLLHEDNPTRPTAGAHPALLCFGFTYCRTSMCSHCKLFWFLYRFLTILIVT